MKPLAFAIILFAGLLGVSFVGIALQSGHVSPIPLPGHAHDEPGAHDHLLEHGEAGDHAHDAVGMERPAFPIGEGKVPSREEAQDLRNIGVIRIIGDGQANPDHGVRSGNGTLDDPFVISGYHVSGDLYIQDTDGCYLIKENWISGQLSLNWNGQCVHVHHNFIRDLRVNENIARDGHATGGLLEMNKIEYVGQLRHYDGEFRHNIVGPRGPDSMWDEVLETVPFGFGHDPRVANIDGFNQGLIHHNTFHGSVDLDFHGHHHGTGFFAPHSHYHGDNESRKMPHDHTQRWTSVSFTDNEIIDPEGYGLRYEDRNHAGDDRVANSEQEETLDLSHVHHSDIEIARNLVQAAPIWVDIFNADDERHDRFNPGSLHIHDNTVRLVERDDDSLLFFGPGHSHYSAIRVFSAKEGNLSLVGNRVSFEAAPEDDSLLGGLFGGSDPIRPVAIDLSKVRHMDVLVQGNSAEDFHYGVKAHEFDNRTHWKVLGNQFQGVAEPVYWDDSVQRPPQQD